MNKIKLIIKLICISSIFLKVNAENSITNCYKEIKCTIKTIKKTIKPTTHPLIPGPSNRAKKTSLNWSGYCAMTNSTNPLENSVNSVFGSWIVPVISKSNKSETYCGIWIGIDGVFSKSVEQIGTAHDYVNGEQRNYAWFEMYPNPPGEISGFPLNIGDSISASVEYIGNNTFKMKLINDTKKVYTIIPSNYTKSNIAQRKSAEWIVEAPFSKGILPLSNFGKIKVFNCNAVINDMLGSINHNGWINNPINMVNPRGIIKAATSGLSNDGQQFIVEWRHN